MKPDYKLVAKAKYIHMTADLASELWHEVYKRYFPSPEAHYHNTIVKPFYFLSDLHFHTANAYTQHLSGRTNMFIKFR